MNKLPNIYLHPSALLVSADPLTITTVLGSCVSVCLWDQENKTGGMNHFMLPYWNGKGLASPKFGNISIEKLIHSMIEGGSKKQNLIAKVFGGASVIQFDNDIFNIGKHNIELALNSLAHHQIKIAARSVGGGAGRKLVFFTHTGEVRQKFLNHGSKNCNLK